MMYPVPFRAEHLRRMDLQAAQMSFAADVVHPAMALLEGPHSHTVMHGGAPVVCAGALPLSEERGALVWSFLGTGVTAHNFREVHGWAKQFIAGLPFRRIEATAAIDFACGRRWMRLLGFEEFDRGAVDVLYARSAPR
jgi:hypothetical protein